MCHTAQNPARSFPHHILQVNEGSGLEKGYLPLLLWTSGISYGYYMRLLTVYKALGKAFMCGRLNHSPKDTCTLIPRTWGNISFSGKRLRRCNQIQGLEMGLISTMVLTGPWSHSSCCNRRTRRHKEQKET